MEKKQRAEAIKKDVIQTLDKQKFEKIMERQAEKEKELLLKQKNVSIQISLAQLKFFYFVQTIK